MRLARRVSQASYRCHRRASARRTIPLLLVHKQFKIHWQYPYVRTFVRLFLQPLQPVRVRTIFVFLGRGGAGLYIVDLLFRPHKKTGGGSVQA